MLRGRAHKLLTVSGCRHHDELALCRMHVHGVLDVMPEWHEEHAAWFKHYWEPPIETAFLKHIRPLNTKNEDGTMHTYPCSFGAELDPKGENLVAAI